MKNLLIAVLFLFTSIAYTFAQDKPRFTEFCTAEETENDDWKEKISVADTSSNYIIQLVTSKNKDDYSTAWVCVQVIDRENKHLVQEIDLSEYDAHGSSFDQMSIWDINEDGYEDFSLFEATYSLDNTTSCYFLFDPETKTFFDSEFEGTNLEFHGNGIISSRNRCCAGTSEVETIYKLVNNKMIVLEEHCMEAVRDSTGSPIFDADEYPIFEEVDCYEPYIAMQLQSVGKNLRMAIYDKDMYGGYILYDGQEERIPIHFNRLEVVKKEENDSTSIRQFFYDEIQDEKNTGTYSFTMQGNNVSNVNYISKKDNLKLYLQIIDIKIVSTDKEY